MVDTVSDGKYVFEDIFRLRMPHSCLALFLDAVHDPLSLGGVRVPPTPNWDDLSDNDYSRSLLYRIKHAVTLQYKDSIDYLFADTARERAIAALQNNVSEQACIEVLEKWIKVADTIPAVEKALLGWDKI